MKKVISWAMWVLLALLGAGAYGTLAFKRGEPLNSAYILVAALCSYAIGYRFYSKWIATRVLMINERRATPCEVHDDGKDFVRTNKWIVFGHHFAAISGPGPLVGPVLAAQFGYLPGTLWILIGVVLGGAVQDFVILFASMRRNGKSLGQMLREELNTTAGYVGAAAILAIMVILLAVLALVVVKALAESPWGVFTVGATIPIALFMGSYLRFWRVGKVLEASACGIVLLLLAVWGGQFVHLNPAWAKAFTLRAEPLAWGIIVYGLAASVLPVWLLLAPRDYLSTFMKLGTIAALALGVFLVLPELQMPALSRFIDGSGPVVAGGLFPFCFITIACGAISGFHTLIASGITPKIITRESYARSIGYGAMCLESLVAIMAIIAACTLEPGVYLSMNIKGAGTTEAAVAQDTVARVNAAGFPVTVGQMQDLATQIGEKTLFGRTGGAATLAVGMAHIFSRAVSGRWLDLWYHFAIMFEALFILTTLDAGTRVGRYLLHDILGNLWKPLGETKSIAANLVASTLMVGAWGYFLIQGVRDPLGGINSLWPLFGIANQLLAAVALCLATTILLKMQLKPAAERRRPVFAWVTLVPLLWLLTVTTTAGVQKIFHPKPTIGFLAKARALDAALPTLQAALTAAKAAGEAPAIERVSKALRQNRTEHFNQVLDAVVAGIFLSLVVFIVLLSLREWFLLLARRRPADLHETEAVWLPDYALAPGRRAHVLGAVALGFALAKELSGEADLARLKGPGTVCSHDPDRGGGSDACCRPEALAEARRADARAYLAMTARRFDGVRRCC
ncbi:MAG: carbon starvation CstA family protein [Verrucomicrobiota bacterium]